MNQGTNSYGFWAQRLALLLSTRFSPLFSPLFSPFFSPYFSCQPEIVILSQKWPSSGNSGCFCMTNVIYLVNFYMTNVLYGVNLYIISVKLCIWQVRNLFISPLFLPYFSHIASLAFTSWILLELFIYPQTYNMEIFFGSADWNLRSEIMIPSRILRGKLYNFTPIIDKTIIASIDTKNYKNDFQSA